MFLCGNKVNINHRYYTQKNILEKKFHKYFKIFLWDNNQLKFVNIHFFIKTYVFELNFLEKKTKKYILKHFKILFFK